MELIVHDQLGINHSKTLSTLSYFKKLILGKFYQKNNWKLEVWLDEKKSKKNVVVSCGVALRRPRKATIYAKKVAGSLNVAVRQSIGVIAMSLSKEKFSWNKSKTKENCYEH